MKLTFTAEDEAELSYRHMLAGCFLLGNGEAEIKVTDYGRKLKVHKLEALAIKAKKKLAKENVHSVYMLAEGGSELEKVLRESRVLKLSRSEYMFSLKPDTDRKNEEGAEILLTNGVEEEEETIIVESGEKGVFTAKLRPFNDGMYIYGVEVREDMRHEGYGTKYMKSIMYAFRDTKLYLQVGSPNVIACKLYRKVGFETETEILYFTL
ncbi:MAG: GNAT family N-acetyltransferase [Lachnospiraceae bacterium]|nr:GNAT family N-acetyltransferase [Lachnospiraceae bacterium]